MASDNKTLPGSPGRRLFQVLAVLLPLLLAGPAFARPVAPVSPFRPMATHSPGANHSSPGLSALPLADSWFTMIFIPIRNALSNRVRMIQFATLGMIIGLFIMMRK
jgi:hypothetical protein